MFSGFLASYAVHVLWTQDESRDYQGCYPAPEPSAPPAYSYNTNSYNRNGAMLYPMADVHKDMYDAELEPLDTRLRSSQI